MKKISILVLLIGLIGGYGMHRYYSGSKAQQAGTIIILNGPSAAGKSTLQKEIQRSFDDLYLSVGIDGFFDNVLPQEFEDGQSYKGGAFIRGISTSQDKEGHQLITLNVGPLARKAITGMHNAFAGYAQAGNNLVIDYILYEKNWLPELVEKLKDYKVYFVGVTVPLAVLEERERSRGTSPIGHARSHFDTVHAHGEYDLTVDTSTISNQEAVERIKQFIKDNPNPQAFKKLHAKFKEQA